MSAPWIEAWKAWLARGAELFMKREGPVPGATPRRAPSPQARVGARPEAAARKTAPHRSGQRHG